MLRCGTGPGKGFGKTSQCQVANGVGWYFHNDPNDFSSWGFAQGGDSVNRVNPCDSNPGIEANPDKRLCWGTQFDEMDDTMRCGANDVSFQFGWERAVFQPRPPINPAIVGGCNRLAPSGVDVDAPRVVVVRGRLMHRLMAV